MKVRFVRKKKEAEKPHKAKKSRIIIRTKRKKRDDRENEVMSAMDLSNTSRVNIAGQNSQEMDETDALKWNVYRKLIITGISVIAVAILLALAVSVFYQMFLAPVNANDHEERVLIINRGSSVISIANQLEREGFIRSSMAFRLYIDFSGKSQMLSPGRYVLEKSMTIEEVIDRLTSGGEIIDIVTLTIVEGTTVEQLADLLMKENVILDKNDFLEACRTAESFTSYEGLDPIMDAENKEYILEGYLYPDTYEFYVASKSQTVINKLLTRFFNIYSADMAARAEELGMTLDEVVTLASMIEKEAKTADFEKVSAVFHNRLKKGMKLESDATVKYITGSNTIITNDSELNVDSPYNTYKNNGLPAGAICNVGRRALNAALNPNQEYIAQNYLYFTLMDPEKGDLYFSKTVEEHKAAVELYRPLWEQFDREHS